MNLPRKRSGLSETIRSERLGIVLVVLAITILGAAIRYLHVAAANFPLNDGGLFNVMIKDLISNRFRLPLTTSYNSFGLPFAYPPLPFYLLAVIHQLTAIDLLTLQRFFPLVLSILAIPAFFLWSREALDSTAASLHAALAFAILTHTYSWQIMGGGITRSLAFTLSLLALWQSWQALRSGRIQNAVWAGVLLALTGYCHLEILMVSALFILASWLFLSPNRKSTLLTSLIGFGSLVLLAPYVLVISSRFGFGIFISALQSGGILPTFSLVQLFLGDLTGEYLFTPILVIALLGLGIKIQRRQFLFFFLVLISALSDPRSLQRSIALPLCLLFGIGLEEVVLPAFRKVTTSSAGSEESSGVRVFPSALAAVLVSYLILRAAFTSQIQLTQQDPILSHIRLEDRTAMAWIKDNTPPESRFLVITSPAFWWVNARSEWFPVLSERRSLTTVQGTEWLAGQAYRTVQDNYGWLTACSFQNDLSCLDELERRYGETYTHIYLSGHLQDRVSAFETPLPIEAALRASPAYTVAYDRDEVVVFMRR